ncbi:MAG: mechanosensitive ion channel, partial [Clostridia bacterium]|nr:mechanosensitive ion channel [Clostridia bacterium]
MLEKILNFIFDLTTSVGLKLLYAILILVVGLLLAKWLVKALKKSKAITHLDESFAKFLCNILQVALNATVIIAAAITIGIPATSFITILGSAGLAIGLALQGSLSNFAGSLMIMLFKPYKVGDYIKSGEIEGVVADINVFYTIV